jgi:hypothetical protein
MGHGLQMSQSVTVLDDAVKRILEMQFQFGVTQSSNMKGVLEMVKECAKTMPTLMAPAIHEINSWLSGGLAKAKKSRETDTGDAAGQRNRWAAGCCVLLTCRVPVYLTQDAKHTFRHELLEPVV